uniref:Uncharacterized protein n=1 Tax=Cacopsylla melanoneura TaxID=428564 RepID=A0A8D9BA41_9HEMI
MRLTRGTSEILNQKLSIMLDRCKLSDRNAVMVILGTVEALGLNPTDYILSRSALRLRRRQFREEYAEEMQRRLNVSEDEAVVVHWDGKLLPNILGRDICERLAVLISYGGKE